MFWLRTFTSPTNGQYSYVVADMELSKASTGHFRISIFTDGSGNNAALDNRGIPIQNRLVSYTLYRYARIQIMTGMEISGYFRIVFDDGSKFENYDNNESAYWYCDSVLAPTVFKQLT
jgi:hypothetical protein